MTSKNFTIIPHQTCTKFGVMEKRQSDEVAENNAPRITNVQREGWRSGFYVGRKKDTPHHFGNPFEVSIYGRRRAIKMFEEWIEGTAHQEVEPERRQWILDHLETLRGKDLMCFCAPALCHAEIYFKLLGQAPN